MKSDIISLKIGSRRLEYEENYCFSFMYNAAGWM